MNRFQYLTGPCLVCKKTKPGAAHGLTPDLAVCDDDWVENNEKALAALDAAGKKAGLVAVGDAAKEGQGSQENWLADELRRLTIAQILEKVDAGQWDADQVLLTERNGQGPRVSLVRELEVRINQ